MLVLVASWVITMALAQQVTQTGTVWEDSDFEVDLTWEYAIGGGTLPDTLTYSIHEKRSGYELLSAVNVADVSALPACDPVASNCRTLEIPDTVAVIVGRCTVPGFFGSPGKACTSDGDCGGGTCTQEREVEQTTVLTLLWTWSGGGQATSEVVIPIRSAAFQ